MKMWEIREEDAYRHTGRHSHKPEEYDRGSYDEGYECGYEDGYRAASREASDSYSERRMR